MSDPLVRLMSGVAARCPGGSVPGTYLVFDTETSGVDVRVDRILQVGLRYVEDGRIVDSVTWLVKRDRSVPISPGAAAVNGLTHEKLAAGLPPSEVFRSLHARFTTWRGLGRMFCGHNIMAFDAPLFEREAAELGLSWRFGDNEVLDTGMMVKGSQLGLQFVDPRETLRRFYSRVSEVRAKGVHWSLDRHCVQAFGLAKYGLSKLHDAGADCEATHYLLEELKARSGPVHADL